MKRTILAGGFVGALVVLAALESAAQPPKRPPNLAELKPGQEVSLFSGVDLGGWKVLDELSFEKHGAVKIEKGELILPAGRPATGIAWKGELPQIDYELSLEAKRIEGEDFFCGLTFPVGREHCTLILGGWGGKATGLSNVDGLPAIENETTGYEDFESGAWYRVRLRVSAEKIEAWIDKSQIVELAVKGRKFSIWWEQEPARPLGVATWYTSGALRNVKFKRLEAR